jgi:gas vesicle protein
MGDKFRNKIDYLIDLIKTMDTIIENISDDFKDGERDELANMFHSVMKQLSEKISKLV